MKYTNPVKKKLENKYRGGVKNNDFSIICSNCIGGVLYHYLGKEFLSPTINLWLMQGDFIKLCCDLKKYMSLDLQFIKTEYNYPVAMCGDIKIYFNHDHDENEAAKKWYRRRERINYDNLYIIMYNGDGITKEDMQKLETVKCKNKVILSPEPVNFTLPYLTYFKPKRKDTLAMRGVDKDIFGIHSILKQYDFISFLNA